jgi:hypothetical protein
LKNAGARCGGLHRRVARDSWFSTEHALLTFLVLINQPLRRRACRGVTSCVRSTDSLIATMTSMIWGTVVVVVVVVVAAHPTTMTTKMTAVG